MKRVTLFAGHYGSGKTNIALNYARRLKAESMGREVVIADLDIVNPYFRTKDSAAELAAEGIQLVVSDFANSNVDFPALPKELYALFASDGDLATSPYVVADIGGDDRGALALGRYAPDILSEGNYEYLGVINQSRPLTRTSADAVEVLREIEASSSGLRFTGLINNTNLGTITTAADVLASLAYAEQTAALMSLPIAFTCCADYLEAELTEEIPNLFPLSLQRLYYRQTP